MLFNFSFVWREINTALDTGTVSAAAFELGFWHPGLRKLLSSENQQICHLFHRLSVFYIFIGQQIFCENKGSRHFFQM